MVPLPKIDEMLAKCKGAKVFSTIDLRMGYHHISLTEDSKLKSAFTTPYGTFMFHMVPFGLCQAPAFFQRLMNQVIAGLPFAMAYLDDIMVRSPDMETHLKHLEIIFKRLEEHGMKIKESKCNFFREELQYLGHIISAQGIRPVPEKLESLKEMPAPKNPKEIKQFLGLAGYYRKFVPKFADVARPLVELTKDEVEFEWGETQERAFRILKDFLLKSPILRYPDPNLPYILFTDASKYAWGAVLTQEDPSEEKKMLHPITYVSGLFKGSQINWAALTKEAYAIYMSVKKLTYYITDADVTIRTDHLPLTLSPLRRSKTFWQDFLTTFYFVFIEY